ncbi:MAG: hypothetical protein FD180_817 [Planctomycetota bacterium]|nr:MAG: hypothetical protein FD180_817 [Planctomycetota bacterium]
MSSATAIISTEKVEHRILEVRGHRVLLDADLARMYSVTTSNLNKAVKRNEDRFPPDFMFRLTGEEARNLIFQSGISSRHGGSRWLPLAFTEHGVAMLSSVLRSGRAVRVNIAIMRAFTRTREFLATQHELSRKLSELERRLGTHDEAIRAILGAIHELVDTPSKKRRKRIGFHEAR